MDIKEIKEKKGQPEAAETEIKNTNPEAEANETASQEPKTKTTASPSTEQESSGKKVPCAPLKVEENYPSVQQTLQPPQKAIADLQKVGAVTTQAAPALQEAEGGEEGSEKAPSAPTSSVPLNEEEYTNDKQGRAKLRKLAKQGNAKAQYQLAQFLLDSSPKSKKLRAEAIDWLKQVAFRPRGNKGARTLLSRLYIDGDKNLPQDPVLVYVRKRIVELAIPPVMETFMDPVFWHREIKPSLPPAVEKEMSERVQGVVHFVDEGVELVKGMLKKRFRAQGDVLAPWKFVDEFERTIIAAIKARDENRLEEFLKERYPEEVHLSAEQAQKLAARLLKEKGENEEGAAEGLNPLRVDDEGVLSFAEDELSVVYAFLCEEFPELTNFREGPKERTVVLIVDRESTEAEETTVTPDMETPGEIA